MIDYQYTRMIKRPNVLFIMVDEMRFPPTYETQEIKRWRSKYMTAQNRLKEEGVEFINHYTASTACAPARTSLFTGQYPTLHGVSQTDGAAKGASDADMFWLDPNTVPCTGDYFRLAGYDTFYHGKWHIAHSDILINGTKNSLNSYNSDGTVNKKNEQIYLNADRLDAFGFKNWVGAEPHGTNPLNSGGSSTNKINGRDVVYVDYVIQQLESLAKCECKSDNQNPWFMVASLVNPHDITLYGELAAQLPIYDFSIDPSVPEIPRAPNANDDLTTKPTCQQEYREKYQQGFQPTLDTDEYRKLYYSLNLTADRNVNRILDAMDLHGFTESTIIVFTSDHGDYIGSHKLFQKWFSAYQEAIHVPLMIRLPKNFKKKHHLKNSDTRGVKIDTLTSHIDILPTLLGMVCARVDCIQKNLKKSHSEVHQLVGRDLLPLLLGRCVPDEPVCFMTNDNALKGLNQVSLFGVPYLAVSQPANIQTVIVKIGKEIWKYSRYYDDPAFWSQPQKQDNPVIQNTLTQVTDGIQIELIATGTKTTPLADQIEMYNVSKDPLELYNLANPRWSTPESLIVQNYLAKILQQESEKKFLYPSTSNVQNSSTQSWIENFRLLNQ